MDGNELWGQSGTRKCVQNVIEDCTPSWPEDNLRRKCNQYTARVYEVDEDSRTVWALAAGIRKEKDQKDIYKIAKKLLNLGLLNYET